MWDKASGDSTNRSAGGTRRIRPPRQQLTKEQVQGRFSVVLTLALGVLATLGTALASHLLLSGPLRIIRRVAFIIFGLAMLAASLVGLALIVRVIILAFRSSH